MATTPQQAAQEVIKLKKQYETNSKADKNYYKSDSAKQLSQQANSLRQQYGLDDSKYGSSATLAQAYTNYYKEYGGTKPAQPTQVEQPQQAQAFEPAPYVPTKYDKQIESLINSLPANMLNYDQAKNMANEQLGASYDKALVDTMKNIDRQSLQNGFFGQLPTVDYKQRNADEIERSRAASISQLASQLVNDSKADVQSKINALSNFSQNMSDSEYKNWQKQLQQQQYTDSRGDVNWEKSFKEKQYTDSRNDVDWEKLFKERQYTDSRTDVAWEKDFKNNEFDWQKGVTAAQLTGIFQGKPTLAYTQLAHNMNMDTKKMQMAEKEMNHNISMSWEKLKLDKVQVSQAWSRIGLQKQGQALDEKKFMAGIKEKAFDMTMKELERTGKISQNDELAWMNGSVDIGTSNVTEKEVLTMLDSYVQVLLGLAVYDEEAPASGTTKYTGWVE